jgi:hypothetical protein
MNTRIVVLIFILVYTVSGVPVATGLDIPPRPADAPGGNAFMQSVTDLTFNAREQAILEQLLAGNIPDFMRDLVELETTATDARGNTHTLRYRVMPIYLAVGSDSNYCRVPMGPLTAQRVADAWGAALPTRKLVDHIYTQAEIKLEPVTYWPVGDRNERVETFILHNTEIQAQFDSVGGTPGQLVGGTKKDVVLSNKITDPARPGHVVIYGWHRLGGNPIQPLTNIHIDTYVDYSHGIRFLDARVTLDGDSTTLQALLKNPLLYKVVSDEPSPMTSPTYLVDNRLPDTPSSFGVTSDDEGEVTVQILPDADVDTWHLYLSTDGISFGAPLSFTSSEIHLTPIDLPATDSTVFVRLTSENAYGTSGFSEVLAVSPRETPHPRALIVNGFDRTSAGNTFDFCRQHATAMAQNDRPFDSATNEAVLDGLVALSDYHIVDYILGDESTADETFSSAEQSRVTAFLRQGGRLFVSGSEIAWDLDYRGSASDKTFFRTYLKADYSADAPGGVSGTHYAAKGVSGELFEGLSTIRFDDGSHGTFNVDWADALIPQDGATAIAHYQNVSRHRIAGIRYEGIFGNGTRPGRLVYLGFPFETVYPESTRTLMMGQILDYLRSEVTWVSRNKHQPEHWTVLQNYPNPFNPSTTIEYTLARHSDVSIQIFNSSGQWVTTLIDEHHSPGQYRTRWDGRNEYGQRVASGVYLYRMRTADVQADKKCILLR